MIYSSSGIVLRVVKYGETSGVITIYTSEFGLQSYIVNGIRRSGKNYKAHLFQPASVLEMQVYHNDLKNLQRIREVKWKRIYKTIFTDVVKNVMASFMVELLLRTIIAEEKNEILYRFAENQLFHLDEISSSEAANQPLKFMLALPVYLGFGIENNYSDTTPLFNEEEGRFVQTISDTHTKMSPDLNKWLSVLLSSKDDDRPLPLNGKIRNQLLHLLIRYYQLHIAGFSNLKSLEIIEMIFRS